MTEQLEYTISLQHLRLTNFRCFKDLGLDFDKKLTVLIAENGGGKTAILDAIAEGLTAYLAMLKIEGYEKSGLSPKSIRNGSETCDVTLDAKVSHLFLLELAAEDAANENENEENDENVKNDPDLWDSNQTEVRLGTALRPKGGAFVPDESSAFHRDAKYFKNTYDIANLPVLVYYGGDSVVVSYDPQSKSSTSRLGLLYKDALTPSRFSFTPFFNWYKDNEDKMFRIRNQEDPEYKTIDNQLKKIKTAVEHILNDDIDNPVYSDLRLDKNLQMGMTKRQPDGGTQFVEIAQFSAGEKALFAFVADLGMRLLQARLDQDFANEEGRGQIRGKGVILIDEVDLHLHPKWQRKVVGKLMEIFPDVQWVMTTHSPYVLQNLKPEGKKIYRLEDSSIKEMLNEHYGRDIDAIAHELQGVSGRPKEIKEKLDEIYEMLNHFKENELDSIVKKVDALSAFLTELDLDIINIRTQLEFAYDQD